MRIILLAMMMLLTGCSSLDLPTIIPLLTDPIDDLPVLAPPDATAMNGTTIRSAAARIHRLDENVIILWDTIKGHGFTYGPDGKQLTAHSSGKRADCKRCRDGIPR